MYCGEERRFSEAEQLGSKHQSCHSFQWVVGDGFTGSEPCGGNLDGKGGRGGKRSRKRKSRVFLKGIEGQTVEMVEPM